MDYEISIENAGEVTRNIFFEFSHSTYKEQCNNETNRVAKKASIKGFRPGKVPANVVWKLYGSQIKQDVIERLFRDAYPKVIKERDLKVVGLNDVEVQEDIEGKPLKLKAVIEIYPEPELKELEGFELEITKTTPTEEEFQKIIAEWRAKDEKAAEVEGKFASPEEFIEKERARYYKRSEQGLKNNKLTAVINSIIEKNPFEVPIAMIDMEIREMLARFGAINPQDKNAHLVDVSSYREIFRQNSEINIKRNIILEKLDEVLGLVVSEEDCEQWLTKSAEEYETTKEELAKTYKYPEEKQQIETLVKRYKTIDWLLSKSRFIEVEKPIEQEVLETTPETITETTEA
jgi:FKBP-type peptidyl-prolyl cis-trans isomerase (trigger factor)